MAQGRAAPRGLEAGHGAAATSAGFYPEAPRRSLRAGPRKRGHLTHAHTRRHSVATEYLAASVDLETVRDILGHNAITTTAIYLHAVDSRKRQAAKRLKLV